MHLFGHTLEYIYDARNADVKCELLFLWLYLVPHKTGTQFTSCKYFLFSIITEPSFGLRISVKAFDVKFHENPSRGSRVAPCCRSDMTKLMVAFRTCFVEDPPKLSSRPAASTHNPAAHVDSISLPPSVATDCLLVLMSIVCTRHPASAVLLSHRVTLQNPARTGSKTITWSRWTNFFFGGGGKGGKCPFQCFSP